MKKILDSHGRVFGIINIFDFLFLLFLILLLPMIYHGYRLTHVKQEFVKAGYHPASDVPASKILLEKEIPLVLQMRNLTHEEASFIKKRINKIEWENDVRFIRLLKKQTEPLMLGTRSLMQVHGLEFLVSVRISVLRRNYSVPDVLFRNAKIPEQIVNIIIGERRFKGFLQPLNSNEQNI